MTEGLHRFYGGNDLHFLTFSCYRRRPLFRNEARSDLFLTILDRVRRRYRFVVLGYVAMPEHVHLLVSEPQRESLSAAIQALKLGVVRSMQSSSGSVVAAPAPSLSLPKGREAISRQKCCCFAPQSESRSNTDPLGMQEVLSHPPAPQHWGELEEHNAI
jgi:REP element-mobilizing transposase RayT